MQESSQRLESYAGIRAMVFGAAGFIGRWVARDLCRRGAKVALVVRSQRAAETIFAQYAVHGEIFALDLENFPAVKTLLEVERPAIVFNLAGYGMDRSEQDEGVAYGINARLVEAVADTMAQSGPSTTWSGQRIVHVGTPLEYGSIGSSLPEDGPAQPTTLYGKSKLAGTQLLRKHCQAHGLKGLTARPFTVYGPGEAAGRLLPSLLAAAKSHRSLPLTSGEQKRDFVYVEDVAEGLLRLGVAAAGPGDIVNLATGRLTSVRKFAETAAAIAGMAKDDLKFGALAPLAEEMHHAAATTERLQRLTGWLPPTGIAEGIEKTFKMMANSPALAVG